MTWTTGDGWFGFMTGEEGLFTGILDTGNLAVCGRDCGPLWVWIVVLAVTVGLAAVMARGRSEGGSADV